MHTSYMIQRCAIINILYNIDLYNILNGKICFNIDVFTN